MMKISSPDKKNGFSLIELMVVVAILALLAAIAYPLYTKQVIKSRRTDARVALETIALAQERFFTVNGSYSSTLSALDIDATLQGGDSQDGYYTLATSSTDASVDFTVTATPVASKSQGSDSDCTSMTLNQLGVKSGSPATNRCW